VFVRIVQVFALLNILLLAGLLYVWGTNWWQLRSKHTLGLVLFGTFLLLENAAAAYLFIMDPALSAWITNEQQVPPVAQQTLAGLRLLEFGGLSFLTWVTWD
jgi:phosphoglycerol transferase MdoB-like AlkP superfamily enzyme